MTCYRIHLEGFFNQFGSIAEIKTWIAELKKRYPDLIGKTADVYKGERHGDACVYSSAPVKIVVSA